MSLCLNKQQGIVLIVALFVVALVSVMAAFMISRLDRDVHRTALWSRNIQAEQYAEASLLWAEEQLKNDWLKQKPGQLIDIMPTVSPVYAINAYHVQSTIEDMQARFNLNHVTEEAGRDAFKRLLRTVNPNLSEAEANELVKATATFLAAKQSSEASGEYMQALQYYSHLAVPYLPSGRPFVSVSEWRLVKGVTSSLYDTMRPYLTALPSEAMLNVQTASAPVLTTLAPNLSLAAAKEIIALRDHAPFVTRDIFANLAIVKNHAISAERATIVSQYFLVRTEVNSEDQKSVLYTLLERISDTGKVEIKKLWQSKGIW